QAGAAGTARAARGPRAGPAPRAGTAARSSAPGMHLPARRTAAGPGAERLEERRQVGDDVLHVHLDAVDAGPAARAVPLEGVVHVARPHLLHDQPDRA